MTVWRWLMLLFVLATTSVASAQVETDLRITKTAGQAAVEPGTVLVYSLLIENIGTEQARLVVVEDTVPLQTTFLPEQSTGGWSCTVPDAGGTCRWEVPGEGRLAPGGAFELQFAVRLDLSAAGQLSNTAQVTSIEADEAPADNTDTELTLVTANSGQVNLSLDKRAAVASALPGDVLVFSLQVANNGNQGSTGVEITELVPEGATFRDTDSTSGWTCPGGGIEGTFCTFAVGGLSGGGGLVDVLFAVEVNEPVRSGLESIDNLALVSDDGSNGSDSDPANNTDTASVALESTVAPDLILAASVDVAQVSAGDAINLSFIATNVGPQGASGTVIAAEVPANTQVVGGSFDCPANVPGTLCTAPVGTLAGFGGSASVSLVLQVENPLAPGVDAILYSGSVADDGFSGPDLDLSNNAVAGSVAIDQTTTGSLPDLALSMSADTSTAGAGERVRVTYDFSNDGSIGSTGVELRVMVGPGAAVIASDSSPFSCVGGDCALTLGTLFGNGDAGSATMVLEVDAPLGAGIETFAVDGAIVDDGNNGPDADTTNNTDAVVVALSGGGGDDPTPDLVLAMTADRADVNAGEEIRYDLVATNVGDQDASGVLLEVELPANTTVVAGSSSAFVCDLDRCVLTVGDVSGLGGTGSGFLVVQVDDPLGAGVTSIDASGAASDDGAGGLDPTPTDNVATVSVAIASGPGGTAPDLVMAKDDSGAEVDAGDILSYTLTVTNNGPQSASGVEIFEMVPEHTIFSAAGSPGFVCDNTGAAGDICVYNAGGLAGGGGTVTVSFAVMVDPALDAGVVAIQNSVMTADDGASGADLNPLNNSATESTPIASTTAADLAIAVSDGGATAVLGGSVVYTLEVENLGSQDAADVVVTNIVPDFSSFDPGLSTPGFSCTLSSCSLSLGSMAAGERETVIFSVEVSFTIPGGVSELVNVANVRHDGPDLNPANDMAIDTTPLDTTFIPDLRVAVTDGDVTVDAGDPILYQMDVVNDGSRLAPNALLAAVFPTSDLIFNAGASSPGFVCAGSCTYTLGDMAPGEALSLDLVFDVISPLSAGVESVELVVAVSDDGSQGPDGNQSNNTATETTPIGTGDDGGGTSPDLVLTMTAINTVVDPGGIADFDLRVENIGNQHEQDGLLLETVPQSATFLQEGSHPGWECQGEAAGSECFLRLGPVLVGSSREYPFAVRVDQEPGTTMIFNNGAVGGRAVDQDSSNNVDSAGVAIASRDLTLTLIEAPAAVVQGDTLVYRMRVQSVGTLDPKNVVLRARIRGVVEANDAANDAEGWVCNPVPEVGLACQIGWETFSGTDFLDLWMTATGDVGFQVLLDARVGFEGMDPTSNNNVEATTTITR